MHKHGVGGASSRATQLNLAAFYRICVEDTVPHCSTWIDQGKLKTLLYTALTCHLLSTFTSLEHHQVVADEVVLGVLASGHICQALQVSFSSLAVLQPGCRSVQGDNRTSDLPSNIQTLIIYSCCGEVANFSRACCVGLVMTIICTDQRGMLLIFRPKHTPECVAGFEVDACGTGGKGAQVHLRQGARQAHVCNSVTLSAGSC